MIFIPFDENFSTEFSYTAEERERVLEDIRANPDQHDILAEMGKMLKSIQIADSVFSEDDLLDYAEKNIELLVQRKYTRDIRSAIFQTYVYSLGSQKAIKFLARYVSDERVAESDAETLIYLSIFNGGPLLLGGDKQ